MKKAYTWDDLIPLIQTVRDMTQSGWSERNIAKKLGLSKSETHRLRTISHYGKDFLEECARQNVDKWLLFVINELPLRETAHYENLILCEELRTRRDFYMLRLKEGKK